MAGSLFRRKAGLYLNQRFQQWRTGYIVLLPEVNPEKQDQNPLFKAGLPDIESLTQEKCINTLGKYILDFEHCVREVEDDLITSKTDKSEEKKDVFDIVLDPLETLGTPLDTTWGLVKTLYLTDSKFMPKEIYVPLHNRARRARSLKYNSHYIYSAFKECDSTKLTEEEHRVANKFIVEGKLNGIELTGDTKVHFTDISRKLSLQKEDFIKRVDVSSKQFRHMIIDKDITTHFPDELLSLMSQNKEKPKNGPWVVNHSEVVFPLFMEYCGDRDLRWNTWLASRQIASPYSKSELQNSNCLEQIRAHRREQAKLLGYPSFADMSMETKMAGSVENVHKILDSLLELAKPLQEKELESLQEFATSCGFEWELKEWDIPFWVRKHKKYLYNWDECKQREFFPYEKVLGGMLKLCEELFGVRLEEDKEMKCWHPDVKFYHLFEAETPKPVAGLYIDPYTREGKINQGESTGHMIGIRSTARVNGPITPLAALVFNFLPPQDEKPCLLSFSAVDTLFKKFGHALQHLLSTVTYSEVSGLSNVEWDAVDLVSNVMSLWLNDPEVLKSISGHYKTGESLPVENVEEVRRYFAGYNLCSELYLSSLDLHLHSGKEFWMVLMKELWSKHFVLAHDKGDCHPCSLSSIVAGELTAAYYTRIWSWLLAHDAFTSFHSDSGSQTATIGARFRDTFLAFGGSCHASEVFRRFQGRDPCPKAFITSLGLEPPLEE